MNAFLSSLAVDGHVSATMQNQALSVITASGAAYPSTVTLRPTQPITTLDSPPTRRTLAFSATCPPNLRRATIGYAAQRMITLQQPIATE